MQLSTAVVLLLVSRLWNWNSINERFLECIDSASNDISRFDGFFMTQIDNGETIEWLRSSCLNCPDSVNNYHSGQTQRLDASSNGMPPVWSEILRDYVVSGLGKGHLLRTAGDGLCPMSCVGKQTFSGLSYSPTKEHGIEG